MRSASNSRIDSRLAHEADKRREKREKLKREQQELELQDCTFQPNINRKTSNPTIVNLKKFDEGRTPLHERVQEIQKQRQERIQNLRAKSELEERQNYFKPQINQRSDKLAQLKLMQELSNA